MVGSGRESRKDNDLFFTCGLIDYIARKTKNVRADVVNQLGKKRIEQVAEYENISIVDALVKVYNSFLAPKIDDYNSSVYYENPSYLFESYRENKML